MNRRSSHTGASFVMQKIYFQKSWKLGERGLYFVVFGSIMVIVRRGKKPTTKGEQNIDREIEEAAKPIPQWTYEGSAQEGFDLAWKYWEEEA